MKEQWLYDYYMGELKVLAEEFVSFTQLIREITDPQMRHQLEQARQHQIDRMFALTRRIRQMNTNPK